MTVGTNDAPGAEARTINADGVAGGTINADAVTGVHAADGAEAAAHALDGAMSRKSEGDGARASAVNPARNPDANAARAAYRYFHTLRVRWAEVDKQDIVFNGHYLMYFDVAITEYWRAMGVPYPAITERWGSDLFVVKASVEYRAPARYDDVLDIGVNVARIGNSSLVFAIGIFRGEDFLIGGELVYVNADPESRKPVPVPQALREVIAAFERGDAA